jgi:hypothetical protein
MARFVGLEKLKAREWVAHVFSQRTGMTQLALDRQFWELCFEQVTPNSSFHQFRELRLFSSEQYRGVDKEENVIRKNNNFHQGRVCFIQAMWDKAIRKAFVAGEFNPQLIYLDTEVMPKEAANLMAYTLPYCPPDTALVVNMVTDKVRAGWKRIDLDVFMKVLEETVPEHTLQLWRNEAESFWYKGDRGVRMLQVSLYKGKA